MRFKCTVLMQVKEPGDYSKEITLDAANGVGALKVQKLLEHLEESLKINNTDFNSQGILNEKV